jgi:flagellar motor switch protein FliN/FliY
MSADDGNLDLLMNVSLGVTAELGRCTMRVSDVLKIGRGSIVELDRLAGAPIDVLVNARLIARGEVVAIDDRFGVRVTEVVARPPPAESKVE